MLRGKQYVCVLPKLTSSLSLAKYYKVQICPQMLKSGIYLIKQVYIVDKLALYSFTRSSRENKHNTVFIIIWIINEKMLIMLNILKPFRNMSRSHLTWKKNCWIRFCTILTRRAHSHSFPFLYSMKWSFYTSQYFVQTYVMYYDFFCKSKATSIKSRIKCNIPFLLIWSAMWPGHVLERFPHVKVLLASTAYKGNRKQVPNLLKKKNMQVISRYWIQTSDRCYSYKHHSYCHITLETNPKTTIPSQYRGLPQTTDPPSWKMRQNHNFPNICMSTQTHRKPISAQSGCKQ